MRFQGRYTKCKTPKNISFNVLKKQDIKSPHTYKDHTEENIMSDAPSIDDLKEVICKQTKVTNLDNRKLGSSSST